MHGYTVARRPVLAMAPSLPNEKASRTELRRQVSKTAKSIAGRSWTWQDNLSAHSHLACSPLSF